MKNNNSHTFEIDSTIGSSKAYIKVENKKEGLEVEVLSITGSILFESRKHPDLIVRAICERHILPWSNVGLPEDKERLKFQLLEEIEELEATINEKRFVVKMLGRKKAFFKKDDQ